MQSWESCKSRVIRQVEFQANGMESDWPTEWVNWCYERNYGRDGIIKLVRISREERGFTKSGTDNVDIKRYPWEIRRSLWSGTELYWSDSSTCSRNKQQRKQLHPGFSLGSYKNLTRAGRNCKIQENKSIQKILDTF